MVHIGSRALVNELDDKGSMLDSIVFVTFVSNSTAHDVITNYVYFEHDFVIVGICTYLSAALCSYENQCSSSS